MPPPTAAPMSPIHRNRFFKYGGTLFVYNVTKNMPKISNPDALRTRTYTGIVYGRQDLTIEEAVRLADSIWDVIKESKEVNESILDTWVRLMKATGIQCGCGQNNPLVLNVGHPHDDGYIERGKDPKHQGRSGKPFWDRQIRQNYPNRHRRRLECSNCSDLVFSVAKWWEVGA